MYIDPLFAQPVPVFAKAKDAKSRREDSRRLLQRQKHPVKGAFCLFLGKSVFARSHAPMRRLLHPDYARFKAAMQRLAFPPRRYCAGMLSIRKCTAQSRRCKRC